MPHSAHDNFSQHEVSPQANSDDPGSAHAPTPVCQESGCVWPHSTGNNVDLSDIVNGPIEDQSWLGLCNALNVWRNTTYQDTAAYQHALKKHYTPQTVAAECLSYAWSHAQTWRAAVESGRRGCVRPGQAVSCSTALMCRAVTDLCDILGSKICASQLLGSEELALVDALDKVVMSSMHAGDSAASIFRQNIARQKSPVSTRATQTPTDWTTALDGPTLDGSVLDECTGLGSSLLNTRRPGASGENVQIKDQVTPAQSSCIDMVEAEKSFKHYMSHTLEMYLGHAPGVHAATLSEDVHAYVRAAGQAADEPRAIHRARGGCTDAPMPDTSVPS